jgi:predicted RNase H-like HicB family nuclease
VKYVYPACFYKEDDGKYSVEFPDLPLATCGNDLADAMTMASDAAAGRILLMLRDGEELPKASNISDVKPDDETGIVSLVCIDLDAAKKHYGDASVKKTLTIPSWLNQAAEQKNINFSSTLKDALIDKLAQGLH